ncbi:MAG TPA: twin-arginine translocase subunit TatA, partial [Candidatus Accumulibacter sp.]|nr:twin-arginine translocase subunit TatA [Accumulibacter sp.]
VKGFKDGIKDAAGEDKPAEPTAAAPPPPPPPQVTTGQTIEGEIREKTRS